MKYKICSIALQGRSHLKNNIPCQDKVCHYNDENFAVIALSDGAGSARLSHFGAENSVKFICDKLMNDFDEYFNETDANIVKNSILEQINKNMKILSKEHNCEIMDLSHTLLFVMVKNDNFIIFHIGDGVIGYVKNNEIKVASKPMNYEFANTTIFTTSPKASENARILKGNMSGIDSFVLMSDGSAESFYDRKREQLAKILERLILLNSILPDRSLNHILADLFAKSVLLKTADDCSFCILSKNLQIKDISKHNKNIIFGSKDNKKIEKCQKILFFLEEEKNLLQISKYLHIKEKFIKKYLEFLTDLKLIKQNGNFYKSLVG